jgi:cysteine desulfurase
MYGGGQQGGLRPGTVPLFLAVGFGEACALARRRLKSTEIELRKLGHLFISEMNDCEIRFELLSDLDNGLPGLLSIRFPGVDAEDMLDALRASVSASTGSACIAGELGSSHVLAAQGFSSEEASEIVRFSLGRPTTRGDVVAAVIALSNAIERIELRTANN